MSRKIERLAEELHNIFGRVSVGHCLRVDDLPAKEAIELCTYLSTMTVNFSPYILESDLVQLKDHPKVIKIDTAIEKRNQQQESLCLMIPSGTTNAAISSLGNTFQGLDITEFFQQLEREFLNEIPKELKKAVKAALKQARERRRIQTEDVVDFLNAVIEQPTLEQVGSSLWYIGLIPDKSAQFQERLKLNYKCTQALAHPLTPHSTIRQRLEETKLRKNTFMDSLERFLLATNIEPPAKNWLQRFAEDDGYDFSHWEFPSIQPSDLEEISLKRPARDPKTGLLVKARDNLVCDSAEAEINAECGPKKKISVAWETIPKTVKDVAYWQVELIPAREDYGDDRDSSELPFPLRKKPKQKTAQISLDMDIDNLDVKWVQVRVVGFDDNESEITDTDKHVIEALSERIFLEQAPEMEDEDETDEKAYLRPRTYPNVPYGYLDIALSYSFDDWNTKSQGWKEKARETDYFSIGVGNSHLCRIGISHIIHRLESKVLNSANDFGRYTYTLVDFDKFDENEVISRTATFDGFPAWLEESLKTFKDKREKLFKHIREQHNGQGIVENLDWETSAHNNSAKMYAEAYSQLLETIRNAQQQPIDERQNLLQFFLSIDSVEFDIRYTTGNQKALLLLPTHPHRILWMAAYAALLNDWRKQVLELPKKQRKEAITIEHLKEITPMNIPFIVPADACLDTANWYVFARNLGFSSALLLSPSCPDWSRVTADILSFLDYQDEIVPTDVKPTRISADIEKYLGVHRYCKKIGLKIGIVNPGNAHLFATAMENLLTPQSSTETNFEDYPKVERLEISAIARRPLPLEIEGLEKKLREEFYSIENIADDASALYPAFTLSLTEHAERPEFPNGDQHLSFHFDAAKPKITLEQLSESMPESISFYGLINRWLSDSASEYGQLKWRYWLALSKPERFERHPVDGKLTDGLLKLSKQLSQSLAFLLDANASENKLCCLTSVIDPDIRGFIECLHQLSDWVLTIDRFFGAEFFDSPNDPFLAELSQKYVIDYSPDFTEGLGDRLLVTTCWQEELTQIISDKLSALDLPYDDEVVSNVISALKSLSGSYVLQLFQEDDSDNQQAPKTIAIGITLHYLIENQHLQGAFLIPLCIHPELFGDGKNLCDFLLVQFEKTNIRITCVDSVVTEQKSADASEPIISDDLTNRLNSTKEMLKNTYFVAEDNQRIGSPLERARLVMLMRYYFAKALRYGFIVNSERVTKFNEILSKIEAGKIQPIDISNSAYLICPTEKLACSAPSQKDGVQVWRLGKSVLTTKTTKKKVVAEPVKMSTSQNSENKRAENNRTQGNALPKATESTSFTLVSDQSNQTDTNPVSVDLPPYPQAPDILLGNTTNEQQVVWKPSVQGSPHVIIIGIPGQGKSVTINTLLCGLQQSGVGILALDFHNDFGDRSKSAFRRLYNPTIWNAAQGLPFSPFEADLNDEMGQDSWKIQAWALSEIFEYVCGLGSRQKDGLYLAIKSCYEDIMKRWDNSLPTISELSKQVERLEANKKIQNGVMARCRPLLEMNVFKPQSEPWNILQTTKPGLVINLKEIGSNTVREAISAFVLRKVYKDILKWEKSEVMKLAIVLDEAHRLAKDKTLPLIMQEARKFGVAMIVASQNINHFHDNVIGTAGTKIVFRTNDPDSKKVSRMIQVSGKTVSGKTDVKQLIENLETGKALVKTPEMNFAKKTKMNML